MRPEGERTTSPERARLPHEAKLREGVSSTGKKCTVAATRHPCMRAERGLCGRAPAANLRCLVFVCLRVLTLGACARQCEV